MSVCSQVFRSGLRRVQSIDAVRYVAPSRHGVRCVEIGHFIHGIVLRYVQDVFSFENSPDWEISESVFAPDISLWNPIETILCIRGSGKNG